MEYGIEYLRSKLRTKAQRVNLRYKYYDMKSTVRKITALIPPEFKTVAYSLGWCGKAVDSIADRMFFDKIEKDDFMLNEIYSQNNADILFDSSILSALISSCSFLYIDKDYDGYPTIQCVDGGNATGIIDPVTNMLTEGYAVLKRADNGEALLEAYFKPGETVYYEKGKSEPVDVLTHKAPYALLVPLIYRPDARRPFGHSRISRSCMDIVQCALRTLLRTEVGAEFYSVPQKYIVGLSQDAEFNNKAATLSTFLSFSKDDEGKVPSLGQFQQQSMAPHIEHMRMLASMFAGETGLTLDDLGFSTDNPQSYDAIKASHEQLRLSTRKGQRNFGVGFINAGFLAACIRDDTAYERRSFANARVSWAPIFEPDASAIGAIGDAVYKINQAVPDFVGENTVHKLTGLESDAE
ncbi:hypothetical protein [Ruminococcus flavefaciens]|uniref:hypothetical protein n=1 Tax=Ruminococcus flavefaciens TaxID=1265 RepID=UPI0026E96689|nr:hypothetical protein [Ruminococcus flavefaciens]